jgi:uncharacterized protein YndB with AHSA1/START domain
VAHDDSTVIERQIRIAAPPETVFEFFIDPQKMLQWLGGEVTVDARPGGLIRIDHNGRDIARGEFLEVVPGRRVVFTWGWEAGGDRSVPPGSTTVEISLVPDGDGTIVRLLHRNLPGASRDIHDRGWEHQFARLEKAAALAMRRT